jgi:hypothetical protein
MIARLGPKADDTPRTYPNASRDRLLSELPLSTQAGVSRLTLPKVAAESRASPTTFGRRPLGTRTKYRGGRW